MNRIDADKPTDWSTPAMRRRIAARYAAERRFRRLGLGAVVIAIGFLLLVLGTVAWRGLPGFIQSRIAVDIEFAPAVIGTDASSADYGRLIREALMRDFADVHSRSEVRALTGLISSGARQSLRDLAVADPAAIGTTRRVWLVASDDADQYLKGKVDAAAAESDRRLGDREIGWIETLRDQGRVKLVFDTGFLTGADSREPELAGIWGATKGSLLTLLITLAIAFPIGLVAALYLEEFAPTGRMTDFIEVNINNLAAVPSIVFGLLGLAVFLNFFGMPRSAPLVGGLTLALMTLPTVIIAARAAIKAVPPSIRDAARGIGASPMQVVFHHVVPSAMPGIMTGTIIGMARALGETAPLLMIGMVAFVAKVPGGFTDAATVLPVQIYIWSDSPERAFVAKVSAAILVLLAFLIAMNGLAVYLRNKFEQHW